MKTYIIVEGADGAGKTTFTEDLVVYLEQNSERSVRRLKFPTRLPTDDELQRKTSEVLFYLNDFEREMSRLEDFEGFVVCDRSFITTLAYQGFLQPPEKNSYYNAIFSLGSSAFFEANSPDDELYLVKLECSTDEALRRAAMRKEGKGQEELDRVDRMGEREKRFMIDNLKRSYNTIFKEIRKQKAFNLPPKASNPKLSSYFDMENVHLQNIATTHLEPSEALNTFLRILNLPDKPA